MTWNPKGDEPPNFRMERIEKLLYELRYEVRRGMMAGEIDECIGFKFYVPTSKKPGFGVVYCEFRTRPMTQEEMFINDFNETVEGET